MRRLAELPLEPVGGGAGGGRVAVWAPIAKVFQQRELLGLLVRRDLKARYKDSALGFFWSLIRPLLQLAIYFVVMGYFLQAAKGIPDFAVYVFAGLTAMGLFTETVVGGTGSIVANAALVKKVYLPREVFPLASVGSALFNFAIQLIVLLLATLLVGQPPIHWQIFYVVPALLLLVVFGTAFALLLVVAVVVETMLRRVGRMRADLRYGVAALMSMLVAFAIWNLSQYGWCDPDSLFQGHAAWHLLGAAAAYLLFRLYASEHTVEPSGSGSSEQ